MAPGGLVPAGHVPAARRAVVWGLCALVAVVASPASGRSDAAELLRALDLAAYPPGEMPPGFSARSSDGRALSLAGLRGKVILLTFWATWCTPCRQEMPLFERLHRGLAKEGLDVVGVNVGEDRGAVGEYQRALRLTFPLVMDPGGVIRASYGVIALPTTFLVARDGRAVARAIGPRDWSASESHALIRALLAELDGAK